VDPASTYLLNLLADQIGIGGPSVAIALAAKRSMNASSAA